MGSHLPATKCEHSWENSQTTKMTGLIILAILGVASAGKLGHHGHGAGHGGQGSVPGVPIGSQPGLGAGIGSQPGLGAGIGSQPGPGVSASGFGTDGEVSITGPRLAFGETAPYEIETGFAVIETGERVQINDGLVHIAVVSISNQQRIVSILAGAGMTYNDFIERTGTIPPQQGMFEVTAGVITINGVYRNINTGLMVVDSTKFVKETVTVREEQVIRSPLPGSVVVSTVPKQTQIVITVTDTATQFFVETTLDTITHTLNHFEPNFNFATVTVLNPETTTVQNIISQTSVTT